MARVAEPTDAAVDEAARRLTAGQPVAFPTETVYGLGVDTFNVVALQLVYLLKGRPADNPLIAHVAGAAEARPLVERWDDRCDALARRFWPGPLTLVLPGGEGRLPDALRGPEGGIAVRHTGHPHAARLVAGLGQPLTSTSANRPGHPAAPGAEAIVGAFGEAVGTGELLVLDGGALGNVPPSTIVDCTTREPRLVREGALPRRELRRAVGTLAP